MIGDDYDIGIVELEIPKNHIHMIIRGKPKLSLSYVMQIIKSISAREFFPRYPEVKKRYFWGGKLWTQSYFVETIGNANEEVIRAHVRSQLTEQEKQQTQHATLFYLSIEAKISQQRTVILFYQQGMRWVKDSRNAGSSGQLFIRTKVRC